MRTQTNPKYAQHFFSTFFFIFLPCANITLPKAFSPVIDKNNNSVEFKAKAAKTKLETKQDTQREYTVSKELEKPQNPESIAHLLGEV